jgi:carboxylesterase type B
MEEHLDLRNKGITLRKGTPTTVTIANGEIQGTINSHNNQRHFLGIPFAAPPVDDLRWKAPQPEAPWEGTFNATRFGNSCMQSFSAFTIGSTISEDCLYLNVFAPPVEDSSNLPVLIFFYGGSWDSGSATCPLYLGQHVVGDSHEDVILVTANYRLNVFGFLGGEASRDEDAGGSTANWGILDQRRSMRWVKENIAAFGGNPDSITIFGESAGAGSVSVHLTSANSYAAPDGPLFHYAGMESGSPGTPWNSQNMSYAETRFANVAKNVGCQDPDSTEMVDETVYACMRALNSSQLYAGKHGVGGIFLDWSPVEDGVELTDQPRNLLAEGDYATNVSILLGTNADEGSLFVDISYDADEQEYEDYIVSVLGPDLGALAMAEYPYADYNGTEDGKKAGHGGFWATVRAIGDAVFSCPARRTARAFSQSTSTYVYFYNHTLALIDKVEPFDPEDVDPLGVFHGSELVMVFDFEAGLITDEETALGEMVSGFWSTFALNGNPNSGDEDWPLYDADSDQVMVLATENGPTAPGPMSGLKSDKCDFWDANPIPPWVMFGYPDF